MFKKLVISLVAAMSLAACNSSSGGGGSAPQAESIYGVWSTTIDGNNMSFDIRENSTVITLACSSVGLQVSGEVPSRIDGNKLEILEGVKRQTRGGDNICYLEFPRMSISLDRSGNQLRATAGGDTKTFNYVRHNEFSKPKQSVPVPTESKNPVPMPAPVPSPSPAPAPAPSNGIFGSWELNMSDRGYDFHVQFDIGQSSTTMSHVCSYQGKTVTASVTVNSVVEGSTLKITSSGSKNAKIGDIDCNLDVQTSEMNYSINGNTLTLTKAGEPQPLVLSRR